MLLPLSFAPSLIAAPPLDLAAAVRVAEDAGATNLHIDIMDGHFVPNLTYGPDMVKALRPATSLFL
ncbi:MAG TPA: ribulose-phosphate 3-epimerase, partial [Alphaproteobacteria bacterium]